MEIIKHKTNFDFIGKRRPALFISTLLNLAIIIGIATVGFNWGIDFVGGTVIEVKFDHPTTAEDVRKRVESGGLHDVSVQGIGAKEENSFLVRLGGTTQLTKETAAQASEAVKKLGNVTVLSPDVDNGILNFRSPTKLNTDEVKALVQPIVGVKEVRDNGEIGGMHEYQVIASGMAERITSALSQKDAKDFEIRRTEYVGPQVGKQLRNKGVGSLIYAMLAILVYVAFRFDFRFAPGAIVAMLHDTIMVAGYYLLAGFFHREFNLTSIAALLTIIGYSVNDTIVVYDRIREEMARYKGKPLPEIINIAVNDTLSRTILTSGVTALSLVGLLIFGVGEIWDFAMAMLVGIIVGTYSSVYIASPLTIWLDERAEARARKSGGGNTKRVATT
ncbi:MAG: protein translocase subunit SecF [Myxococcaceae bacterium]